MENFNPTRWLDDEYLSAKKAADNVQLIRNYTYFGTVLGSEIYYDLVIPTKSKTGVNWWRINIMPVYNSKRADNVSKIDLKTIIIDDNIFLPLGGSDWPKRLNHKDAVVNTIPYFEDWAEIFEQLSDILDRMIAKKEGTEIEESTNSKMNFETAKMILENAGCKLVKENIEPVTEDYDFVYLKKLFNGYNFDYARSYGPRAAYEKVLEELKEDVGEEAIYFVPDSYEEWEDVLGWSIGEEPPSDDWYN